MAHDDGVHVKGQAPHGVIEEGRQTVAGEIQSQCFGDRKDIDDTPWHHLLPGKIDQADDQLHAPAGCCGDGRTLDTQARHAEKAKDQNSVKYNIESQGHS